MKYIYFCLLFCILFSCRAHNKTEDKKSADIGRIPQFRIASLDSSRLFNTADIKGGKPTIFFYFDPDCEHCRREVQGILKNHDAFDAADIYMIANYPSGSVSTFTKHMGLDKIRNVMVGLDYEFSFYRSYLPEKVPFIAVYNGKRSLVHIYKGEADIDSIANSIRQ